jgi:2-polyprenyl-3-methyl-5-hydroxy-6-metoxy-1,4-benzoquinol methylase
MANFGSSGNQYSSLDWRENMTESWTNYLCLTLGRPLHEAQLRAKQEISGATAHSFCNQMFEAGVAFASKKILEVGSGHGSLALALADRGGYVTAIEPCASWRDIAAARLQEANITGQLRFTDGDGQNLAFPDQSFDFVVSRQVLEHVAKPQDALTEMVRVLKPGGAIYLSCENYLSFHEPHYDVPWLPILPKFLGSMYLRFRGRDPRFLMQNIRYTTFPQLLWWCIKSNLWSQAWGSQFSDIAKPVIFARVLFRLRHQVLRPGFSYLLTRID